MKTSFKPVKLCLKIDLVLHPVCVEGLDKYIYLLKFHSYTDNMYCPDCHFFNYIEKENSIFKPAGLCSKIDLAWHSSCELDKCILALHGYQLQVSVWDPDSHVWKTKNTIMIIIILSIYLSIYCKSVVTNSLCGFVANQVWYNLESARYLW